MTKRRNMLAMRLFVKAACLTVLLVALNGCGTTPMPVPAFSCGSRVEHVKSVAQAPPSHLAIVIRCIAEHLEENAGLKIAGVITEEGELPYVFAAPEKSGGLIVVRISEVGIAESTVGIRLTLLLRVFDGSGRNIYTRSITSVSGDDALLNQSPSIEKALQVVTKDVLRQFAKDPTLRPLILKYKVGSLLNFI